MVSVSEGTAGAVVLSVIVQVEVVVVDEFGGGVIVTVRVEVAA